MMNYAAGFLKVCAWTVMVSATSQARRAPKQPSCSLKGLTNLTRSEVAESLALFEEANGNDSGTWSPGFPELRVRPDPSKIQCSLLFMVKGLEEVLEDQRSNLNPGAVALHGALERAIFNARMLANCVNHTLGWQCDFPPPAPAMPTGHLFQRIQWSCTLLQAARGYLKWLQHQFSLHCSKATGKGEGKVHVATHPRYLEASGYLP
ncbi:uncharacterized protein LOC118314244 isoform X2 [Scophthalmus maximus]|uniref:uncharacterized protein LOC118314244 isoform X2 n=1 Tax=Scophthalmus maximus TaxID=52904 RepID=UPI0015E0ABB2|nr:uncharacterized protein LOC118314244 isoform X2 [Scophthalmus maximus]